MGVNKMSQPKCGITVIQFIYNTNILVKASFSSICSVFVDQIHGTYYGDFVLKYADEVIH